MPRLPYGNRACRQANKRCSKYRGGSCNRKINVDYDGYEEEVLNGIPDIVKRLGYEAELVGS